MFRVFSLLADAFAALVANSAARRVMTGIAFVAVIAAMVAIAVVAHTAWHMMPLAGPGAAWTKM